MTRSKTFNDLHVQDRRSFLVACASIGTVGLLPSALIGTVNADPSQPTSSPPDSDGAPEGEWDLWSRGTEGSTDLIQTIDFTLSNTTVGAGKDIAIVADTITVVGQVTLSAKNIFLFARQLTFQPGSSIDTSGPDGVNYLLKARDGQSPGDPGQDGDLKAGEAQNQSAGGKGGNISVFANSILGLVQLRANGGNGGKGQKGGNGLQGAQGPVGQHASRFNPPGNGGIGGQGGHAGMGGIGGQGGNTGQIKLNVLNTGYQVGYIEAKQGRPGGPGDPGDPGNGGIGGDPGNPTYSVPPHPGPRGDGGGGGGQASYGPALRGPNGPKGADASPQHGIASPGTVLKPIVDGSSAEAIGKWASLPQLRMLFQSAELSFLNGEMGALAGQLTWIVQLASVENAGDSFFSMRSSWNGQGMIRAASEQEWKAVARSSGVMFNRYRSGLNAFGYAPQQVSQLSFEFISKQTKQFLDNADSVEKCYLQYLSNKTDLQNRRTTLANAVSQLTGDVAGLKNQAINQGKLADQIQSEIAPLVATLDHLQNELLAAQSAFEAAVQAKGACNFVDIIKFAAGVISIACGVYAGAIAIADAFEDANDELDESDNFIDSVKVLAGTFKDSGVEKDFTEMQQGYKNLQDVMSSKQKENAKLVVSLESFEKQLQPFLDLPAAQKYRDLLRSFVDITKSKNDKQVAYTQAIIQSQSSSSQADKLSVESAQTTITLAQASNPALDDEVQFLSSYLQTSKSWILEMIDLKRRALMYKTLLSTPINLNYRDVKVVDLRTLSDKIDKEWVNALNQLPSAGQAQPFQAVFNLVLDGITNLRSVLSKKNEVIFSIPIDYSSFNRGGTCFVSLTSVSLDLSGIKSKTNRFTAQLEHQGSSAFVNGDGAPMNFLHLPRLVNLEYDFISGKWVEGEQSTTDNLGQSDRYYILLSPFASWRLTVKSDTDVDWSSVKSLNFCFTGTSIPRSTSVAQSMSSNHQLLLKNINAIQK